MRRIPLVLAGVVLLAAALFVPAALAQSDPHCSPGVAPHYVFGFKNLHDYLGPQMGDPLTCEFPDPNGTGDVHQVTTEGLAFWRKSTNTPTFTNGWEHWAITERGLVYWTGDSIDPPVDVLPVETGGQAASLLSRAGGKLVFVASSGDLEVLENGNRRKLVSGQGLFIHSPVWSPDGTQIAYIAAPELYFAGRQDDIYVIPAAGGQPRKVTHLGRPLHHLAWFPDGRRLLFGTGFNGGFRTHSVALDSANVVGFYPPADARIEHLHPRLSPDGEMIAALETVWEDSGFRSGIYVAPADGKPGLVLFEPGSDEWISAPNWTPEGNALAFSSGYSLVEAPLDRSAPRTVVDIQVGDSIAYSQDGSLIAATAVRGRRALECCPGTVPIWGLLIVRRDGAEPRVHSTFGDLSPGSPLAWANGDTLFLVTEGSSASNSGYSLYVIDSTGSTVEPVVDIGGFGSFDWHL